MARELESPFFNVPNDLPLNNFQAQFNEALLTMFAGYHPDAYWEVYEATEEDVKVPEGDGKGPEGTENVEQLVPETITEIDEGGGEEADEDKVVEGQDSEENKNEPAAAPVEGEATSY